MNDPGGSVWRKWDLHFHTPASYDHRNKGLSAEDIVSSLKTNGISVVAITDHHNMNVDLIRSLRAHAGTDLTVFPGIELRSELGGRESVHFIGIFAEDCDLDRVWRTLQVRLHISPEEVKERGGNDVIYADLKESATVIHELGGIVTVHAGKKTNSIESISNAEAFKRTLKADLAREFVDILEVGKLDDIEDYRQIVFPHIGRPLPLIIGSDNHNATLYSNPHPCWIKADPTFKGLMQVLQEPEDRVFVGLEPTKLKLVRENPTRFISAVRVTKNPGSLLSEAWFTDVSLPLSHDLVAIIGNKGSGKSALADILGLLGSSKQEEHFSFLQTDRFRHPRNNKARSFTARLTWEDGRTIERGLGESVRQEDVEVVTYLPQSYLEQLCNEIGGSTESDLDKALERVIFAHVAQEARLGHSSLRTLLSFRTGELTKATELLRGRLHTLNAQIVDIELRLRPSNRASLEAKLLLKQQELEAHILLAPTPVEEPANTSPELAALAGELEIKNELLQLAEKTRAEATEVKNNQHLRLAVIQRLNERLDNFQQQFVAFTKECATDAEFLGVDIAQIISLTINRDTLAVSGTTCDGILAETAKELDVDNEFGAAARIVALTQEIRQLQTSLDEPNASYQRYRDALHEWEKRKSAIEGSPEIPDSLKSLQAQKADLENLPENLQQVKMQRDELTKETYRTLSKITDVYRELHHPVQQFIEQHPLITDKLRLNFEVSLVDTGFSKDFLDRINQGVIGSFSGVSEGQAMLANLMKRNTFATEEGALAFVTEIMDHLTADQRGDQPRPVDVSTQLKKGNTTQTLYDFVFSLSYLSPKYVLRLGDAAPSHLSPGEKGTLLLVFYLLLDPENTPLIIDQPEENLDNQTVFDVLVPCIKEAKKRRQVVIVTHNPNLAVVCDAEQIIYTSLDKFAGYNLGYQSGSIESPEINRHLVNVLEGTLPAFSNRKAKYMAHQDL